jgi:hypothetical protein
MGVVDSLNLGGLGGFFKAGGFVAGTILLIVVGIVVFGIIGFFAYRRMNNTKEFYITVNLFKFVNGKRFFIKSDKAKEIVIPGTNVRLLKWKSMGIFSAYPTRAMGHNIYAYNINRFGELTNFDFSEGEDETEAKMDFDHRDQTYAYLNLQQLINRNWREKNTLGWWKENLPLITVIITTLLLVLAMWFFFSQSSQQLAAWTDVARSMGEAADTIAGGVAEARDINSGIVPAS